MTTKPGNVLTHLQNIIDDFSFFYSVNLDIQQARNMPEAMGVITSSLVRELDFGFSAVFLFFNGKKKVRLTGIFSESVSDIKETITFSVEPEGWIAHVLKTRLPHRIKLGEFNCAGTQEEKFFEVWELEHAVIQPLMYREDVLGVLIVQEKNKKAISSPRLDTLRMFANQVSLSIENMILVEQLRAQDRSNKHQYHLAQQIQQGLLTQDYPLNGPVSFFAKNISMQHIGGDLYDIVQIDDDHIGLFIADVTGHGMPAALIMSMTLGLFRNLVTLRSDPAELFFNLNNHIINNLGHDSVNFVTAFYALIDLKEMSLTCSRAGHPVPLLYQAGAGRLVLLEKGGFFLGGIPNARYKNYFIQLAPNDLLLLYTDGILECKHKTQGTFGMDRLRRFIDEFGRLPADDFGHKLLKELKQFNRCDYPEDDWTVLTAKVNEERKP